MKAIIECYPEMQWLPWKFQVVPRYREICFVIATRHFWDDKGNIKAAVKWLSEQLKIENLDDWYSVSYNQVNKKFP